MHKKNAIPRDTSFTVYGTFIKERKTRPYIKIAEPLMPEGVRSKENVVYSKIGERQLFAMYFILQKRIKEVIRQ